MAPGTSSAEARNLADNPGLTVLSNTPAVQAVWDIDSSTGGAVFYQAGQVTFLSGKTLQCGKSGIILVTGGSTDPAIWYADPTQTLRGIVTVKFGDLAYHARLPEGDEAGSSVRLQPVRINLDGTGPVVARFKRLSDSSALLEYVVESSYSPAPDGWVPFPSVPSVVTADGGWETVEVSLPAEISPRFYRLRIENR